MPEQATLLQRMVDQRLSCWDKCKEITGRAFEEKRALTGEEQRQWDAWEAEMTTIDTQVQAIAEAVRDHLASLGVHALSTEGIERGQWALLDYGDVVVHVFQVPVRAFYDLDRLWARAPRVALPEPYQSQARSQKTGTENV